MEQDIATQVVGLGGATDFSLWSLFLRADFISSINISKNFSRSFLSKLGYVFDSCLTKSDLVIGNFVFTYFFSLSFFFSLSDKDEKGRFFPDKGELNFVTASLF